MADQEKSMKRSGEEQGQTPTAEKAQNDISTSEAPNELARHAGSPKPANQGEAERGDDEKQPGS